VCNCRKGVEQISPHTVLKGIECEYVWERKLTLVFVVLFNYGNLLRTPAGEEVY
jgi:hypothetical protein